MFYGYDAEVYQEMIREMLQLPAQFGIESQEQRERNCVAWGSGNGQVSSCGDSIYAPLDSLGLLLSQLSSLMDEVSPIGTCFGYKIPLPMWGVGKKKRKIPLSLNVFWKEAKFFKTSQHLRAGTSKIISSNLCQSRCLLYKNPDKWSPTCVEGKPTAFRESPFHFWTAPISRTFFFP